MSDLDTLTRTALPSSVRIEQGQGGLPKLAVASRHGAAEIYFQGAHVTAWTPTGADPVLWVSRHSHFAPGSAIRGGVPICFPWFGAHASDPAAPAHGFARLRNWTLVRASEDADGIVALELGLASPGAAPHEAAAGELAEPASPHWPHHFRAIHRVTVGPRLTMELFVENAGDEPFTYEEALHTYFAVRDVRTATVTGLEGADYLDKVADFARRSQGSEPIRFTGETDRVYLDTRATCLIHDPGTPGPDKTIIIGKTGSDTTVVWNPWIDKARAMRDFGDDEWPAMVCVETCNVKAHAVTLAPGATHVMTATLDVAPRR